MTLPVTQTARRLALRVSVIYALGAGAWIVLSDRLIASPIPDANTETLLQTYKGLGFVVVTAVLLFLLLHAQLKKWEMESAARRKAETESNQLAAIVEQTDNVLTEHEREIARLSRLYATMSRVNKAIVRIPSRAELFQRLCEALVEQGGFRMAWVGWHDPETRQLVPQAACGDGKDYIHRIKIYSDDRPEGRGPSGKAFRTGQPYLCNDMLGDPDMTLWREEIERRGFKSSAAFPIRFKDAVSGVFNVYSDKTGFFGDREVSLLMETCTDLSFGLENQVRESERLAAEEAAQSERLFSATMIESMPGVIYFYDDQGRFLRWNHNFEIVSGYSGREIAQMKPQDFFAKSDHPALSQRIGEVFDFGESYFEGPLLAKDGTSTPYFFTGRRVDFDGKRCLVGMGIDIAKRKHAEMALRELNETLEHKVADRTAELQAALIRAEAADQIKSAFLATMSHELRTPLNSIIGFTGIVLQGLAGPVNPEQAKQLGMVRTSAHHLLELINDVLDLSKIEAGQLEVRSEPFNLKESIERVVATVRLLAEKKGLVLSAEVPATLSEMTGDRRRVEQILINLLNNAIKFTEHGSITLLASLVNDYKSAHDAEPQQAVRISVTDTGIGIRPEDLALLFQPFRQVDTGLSRQHEGTGLGLAICRRLAALMGGEIHATSEWSKGSSFTVTLPFRKQVNA